MKSSTPARALTATPSGIEASLLHVSCDVEDGPAQIQILGLPDAAAYECRERVRWAIRSSAFDLPPRSYVVALSPADLPKHAPQLDLAIALALLAASRLISPDCLLGRLLCGELSLSGSTVPLRTALAIAELPRHHGLAELLIPSENAAEVAAVHAAPVIVVGSLAEAVRHLTGEQTIPAFNPDHRPPLLAPAGPLPDLSEIRGQEVPKRALEIAAAGGHNLLLVGPYGSGKTMLARRLPTILPPLMQPESVEVTKIHSLASDRPLDGLIRTRPFRSPHHTASTTALLGAVGSLPQPGEVSLAHAGVLFLDELPEFRRAAQDALRLPLDEGTITLYRRGARYHLPARFLLVGAMAPCPCGHLGDPRKSCRCTPSHLACYRRRLQSSLLERIDLFVEVPAVTAADLRTPPGESSESVALRVRNARVVQQARSTDDAHPRHHALDPAGDALLRSASSKFHLSPSSIARTLKVARTIADLAGSTSIRAPHLAEALQYRVLDVLPG